MNRDCKREKALLRQKLLQWRNELNAEELRAKSNQLCRHLAASDYYKRASVIMAYASFQQEVSLDSLVEQAWSDGKTVLLPKVVSASKELNIYAVSSWDELKPGVWGIREPDSNTLPEWNPVDLVPDLIVVPGVGFDYAGHRLGYGGGYYDRWLHRLPYKPTLIGVTFQGQIVHSLPTEEHDFIMDEILTENGFLQLNVKE